MINRPIKPNKLISDAKHYGENIPDAIFIAIVHCKVTFISMILVQNFTMFSWKEELKIFNLTCRPVKLSQIKIMVLN